MRKLNQQYAIPLDFYESDFINVLNLYSRQLNMFLSYPMHLRELLRAVFGLVLREDMLDGDFKQDLLSYGVPSDVANTIILTLVRKIEHALIDLLEEKAHHSIYTWELVSPRLLIIYRCELTDEDSGY